jgi:hypothetical protein
VDRPLWNRQELANSQVVQLKRFNLFNLLYFKGIIQPIPLSTGVNDIIYKRDYSG